MIPELQVFGCGSDATKGHVENIQTEKEVK
jgi:hypothetical protein